MGVDVEEGGGEGVFGVGVVLGDGGGGDGFDEASGVDFDDGIFEDAGGGEEAAGCEGREHRV